METPNVASLLAIELPSVVSPPFAVETPTVASLLAVELPSVVSPPFAVETPTVSVATLQPQRKHNFSEVVSHLGVGQSDRIERVQNNAMRIILRKPPRTYSDSLRQALSWTTLKARRHNAMLSQVHRCVKGQAPFYLSSKFTLNSSLATMALAVLANCI